jgi:hypothetical protein
MMPAADGTRGIKLRMRAIPTGLYRRPNTVRDSSFQPIGGVHFRLGICTRSHDAQPLQWLACLL